MAQEDYKKTLQAAQAELEELLIKQEEIEQRIARVKQAIISLAPLAEEPGSTFWTSALAAIRGEGISDTCRQILQSTGKPLSPVEIKQQLLNMGIDLSRQKNVMASIHSLLKRLVANDEIETRDEGLTYKWKRRYGATNSLANMMATTNLGWNQPDELPLQPAPDPTKMPPAILKGKK